MCESCNKFDKGGEKLKSVPVPYQTMNQLGIDLVTNLPVTPEGYNTIVTAVDYTSKWVESRALKGKFAEGVAEFMYDSGSIVEYIVNPENLVRLRSYIPQEFSTGEEYVKATQMHLSTTWATEVELFACAQLSGKDVVCYFGKQ